MKEKYKIEGDNLMVSTDGGKTYISQGKATQAQKDSYAAHEAKKGVEKKIKNWAQPTQEELATLDPQEADYLKRLHANHGIPSSAPKTGAEGRLAKAAAATGDVPLLIEPYGYGTNKLHHSKYDKAQWEKWAKETEFKPTKRTVAGQNKEFQEYLLKNDKFKDRVLQIHTDLGMPYAGHPEDALLGERWDKIMEKLTAPEEDKVIPPAVEKPKDADRKPVEQHTPIPYGENQNAPWWLQDTIKTFGAVGDMARLKKYLPWQATPQVRLPEATFYDPTRELAANTEMANMAMQNSAAFTNPQQQAAANTVAQGQMAKAAADTMGRYNNLNVQTANQLSQQQAGILNQASQNKANLDTQLYDKYTVANQQFDNSKAQARQNIRQSYMDAITNRANTANLNTLYPQYAVNPGNGGFAYFRPDPNKIDPATRYDHYDALWQKAQKYSPNPDVQEKIFRDMLGKGAAADPAYEGYEGYNNNPQAVS
jgi:hypothetical protein